LKTLEPIQERREHSCFCLPLPHIQWAEQVPMHRKKGLTRRQLLRMWRRRDISLIRNAGAFSASVGDLARGVYPGGDRGQGRADHVKRDEPVRWLAFTSPANPTSTPRAIKPQNKCFIANPLKNSTRSGSRTTWADASV